jgi:hypothetical protein
MRTSPLSNGYKESAADLIKARSYARPRLAFRSTKLRRTHLRTTSVVPAIPLKEFVPKPRSMSLCSSTSNSSDDEDDFFRSDFSSKLLFTSSPSESNLICSDTPRTPMLSMRLPKVVLDNETCSVVSLSDERPSSPVFTGTSYVDLCLTPEPTCHVMLSPPVLRISPPKYVFLHVDPAIASTLYLPETL